MPELTITFEAMGSFGNEADGTAISGRILMQLQGAPGSFDASRIKVPFGLSYADFKANLSQQATEILATFYQITLPPDITVKFFGLPAPTLADLGG